MKNILLTGSLRSSPLVAPATKGGMHFQRPQGGCMVFRRAKARLSGFRRQRRHLYWRPQGRRTSPAQRYYITPEGESPQPACKAKPITGRTLGAQGQRPGGAINPRGEAASTYGNTGKHRPCPGPDRAEGACPHHYLLSMRCLNLIPLNPVTFRKYLARYSDTI